MKFKFKCDEQSIENFLAVQLSTYEREVFCVIFLDNSGHLIAVQKHFYGYSGEVMREVMREVIMRAVYYNAKSVIFAHNHPSGNKEASSDDLEITKTLKEILRAIDVDVVDHFVIAAGNATSIL